MSVNEVKSLKYNLIGGGLPFSCKVVGGKIIPALAEGDVDPNCQKNIWYAAAARNTKRIFMYSDVESLTKVEDGYYNRLTASAAQIPFVIEFRKSGEHVAEFIFDEKVVLAKDTTVSLYSRALNVGGGVYKNGRVFAIDLADRCKIRWSGEGGSSDWEDKIDGAGWLISDVELGEIYRLYVFKGQIAALKANGISLISAYGTPEDFKEIISIATPSPYKDCATVCGDKLYFYTKEGLYAFNGAGVEKVSVELAKDFVSPVYSMTYDENIFFTGTHKKLERTVILVYNPKEKSSYFIDSAATALCAGNKPYAFTPDGLVTLTHGVSFKYESEKFANFSKRKKALKSVFVNSEKCVDVTVQTDVGSRVFKDVKGELKTHMYGCFFKVGVEGTDGEIRGLTATVEFY